MSDKILIVEDNVNILYALQAKFSTDGTEVMALDGTTDLNEMVSFVIKNQPKFIILDLILPKVDGIDLLKEIKSKEGISDIPIFVFTNLMDDEIKQKCMDLGADYYFVKTDYHLDEFIKKINKIVGNKKKVEKK
jgi:two-component system alkaline phosphatase synthesis response regulator PhoP